MSKRNTDGPCFQWKADFFPMTVLKLTNTNITHFSDQLQKTLKQAPNYFANAPIVIDVAKVEQPQKQLDLAGLCTALREQHIIPVGLRGLDAKHSDFAASHGLALVKASKPADAPTKPVETAPADTPKPAEPLNHKTKIITKPVRSGSRIYAKGGDLIVLAAVNAGGEVIADGNIHIYGPLRGRALAGALGDSEARIFCRSLDAELISIAGHYQVKEHIKTPKATTDMMQIFLDGEKLQIEGV